MIQILLLVAGFGSLCVGFSVNKIRLCQGDITDLHCPSGQHLQVKEAKYGRFVSPKVACAHESLVDNELYNCSKDVTSLIRRECESKPFCSIKATNRMLGDPCRRTYKHLDITFMCSKNTEPTTPSTPPTEASSNDYKMFMVQIENCTRLYNKVKSVNHCDALLLYISCVKALESSFRNYVSTIDNALDTLQSSYDKCTSKHTEPLLRICKKRSMLGECRNITQSAAHLDHFDNAVKSIHVYGGSWILYSDRNFRGQEYFVSPGFRSNWLGIYSPVHGENIELASNTLSSIKRVVEEQNEEPTVLTEDYTQADDIVSDTWYTRESFRSTPMFYDASSTSESLSTGTTTNDRISTTGHFTWVYLNDILNSKHYSKMCRTSYCLLGIRVAYEGLENQGYLDAKQTEKVIFNSLIENYHVRPEQIIAAEVERNEVIIEIIDMKEKGVRVLDVAIEIEHKLKLGEFTFKFFAQKEAKPQRNRYTLMLKMMNEQELPVSIKDVTTQGVGDESSEVYTISSTSHSPVSTSKHDLDNSVEDGSMVDRIDNQIEEIEKSLMKAPYTYLYIIGASVLTVVLLIAAIIQYKRYSSRSSTDYTLIKKVPSNVYVPNGSGAKKNLEGFENPSYLLDEVDQ